MSKSALADAYAAGFKDGRSSAATVQDDDAATHCVLGFDGWWQRSVDTLDRDPLTADDQRRQGQVCSCRGTDDYCPCQNVRLK
jgi:hypothetical protein